MTISRRNLADGRARAIVVVSKNANVANGADGHADAEALVDAVAARLGCDAGDVLVASTGVIGRRYPLDRMLAGVAAMPVAPGGPDLAAAARGIMTTDTVAKVAECTVGAGPARVVGMAKGVGMIEPDMATMIAVLADRRRASPPTRSTPTFRRVVDRTFNCVSIDTDTSTSDTAVVLASRCRRAGRRSTSCEAALGDVAESLTRQIARDGEGAETLIEVVVDAARDRGAGQAGRQGDRQLTAREDRGARRRPELGPGRDGDRQVPGRHRHRPGAGRDPLRRPRGVPDARSTTPSSPSCRTTCAATRCGSTSRSAPATRACTVWGCDLTAGYVRINADYTT